MITKTQGNNGSLYINITNGTTCNNLVFKPMITTNLSATYDDFVPYTGDGETLTHDVAKQNESLSVIGKCKNLLNPTLQTTTKDGVTCTANGDGTYTLNGTAGVDTYFDLERILKFEDKIYKIVAFKNATSNIFSYVNAQSLDGSIIYSILNEYEIPTGYISKNEYKSFYMGIGVLSGTTLTNEIVKPMLTTDLNATYDDYVPYTGDGETLTHDVAKVKNDLDNKNCGYMDFSTNWNNVTKTGLYNYNGWGGTGGGSNRPTDTKCIGVLMVANTDNATMISQTFISKDMKVYIRIYSDGAWGSWGTTS